jgi:hypothetical protein
MLELRDRTKKEKEKKKTENDDAASSASAMEWTASRGVTCFLMTTRLFRHGGDTALTKLPNQEVDTRASLVMRQQTRAVDDDPSAVIERATFIIHGSA